MKLNDLRPASGSKKSRTRKGRGVGSGKGKTAGRGTKGCNSRSGGGVRPGYEGGQTPLHRRLPKRGFSNNRFATRYEIINVSQLERFEEGQDIGLEQLSDCGLISDIKSRVKILGDGDLTKNLRIEAHKFSKTAEQKIMASGGTVKVL